MLDVFAGSGSVGLEAVTRGAQHVLFVEGSAKVIQVLKANCALLDEGVTCVIRAQLPLTAEELMRVLPKRHRFDLIFVDPPYRFRGYTEVLNGLMSLLEDSGELAIEHSAKRDLLPLLRTTLSNGDSSVRTRIYGDSQLSIISSLQGWSRGGTNAGVEETRYG